MLSVGMHIMEYPYGFESKIQGFSKYLDSK